MFNIIHCSNEKRICAVMAFFGLIFFGSTTVYAQPTDRCTAYSGTGIAVSDYCEPKGFYVEPGYGNNFTGSSPGCSASTNSSRKDAYWWFQATSTETIITYYPTGGSVTAGLYDPILTVFTGNATCDGNNGRVSNVLACANNGGNGEPETLVISTVVGTKYRIRIQNVQSNNDYTMYGQICVMNRRPVGDFPCEAVALAVDSTQKSAWFTTVGANYTTRVNQGSGNTIPAPGCGTYDSEREDVWFRLIMPSTDLVIDTEPNGASSMTNSTMAVYRGTGSCPSLTLSLVACDTDSGLGNMSRIHVANGSGSGEIPTGTVLYVRVWANGANNSNNGLFGVSAYTSTKCGNPLGAKNDFCENPAVMYKEPNTSFHASTAGVFTPDIYTQTPNWSCTGGSSYMYIHNNSWYKFTADETTEVFPFSASCSGLQAVVLEIGYTSKGCCNTFTRRSNCIFNMSAGANAGTITATGLTRGRDYVLMVDGYGGARCDFVITGWNATNILLGIELSDFSATSKESHNLIQWTTASEINNDYFTLLRSYDGFEFETIAVIDGAGNATGQRSYQWEDFQISRGTVYYKLQQTDFDGASTTSNIISLNRKSESSGIMAVYPNPADGEVTITLANERENGVLQIVSVSGQVVYETTLESRGVHSVYYDLGKIDKGVYIVKYSDELINSVKQFVKK